MIEYRKSQTLRHRPKYMLRDPKGPWMTFIEIGKKYGALPATVSTRFFIHVMKGSWKFSTLEELGSPLHRPGRNRKLGKRINQKTRYITAKIHDHEAHRELKMLENNPDEYDRLILAGGEEGQKIRRLRDAAFGTEK